MAKLTQYLTTLFIALLMLQFAPTFIKNIQALYHRYTTVNTKVGVIPISDLSYASCYARQLKKFFKDEHIKAIVLKINSPGGAASVAQALITEIKDLRQDHPKVIISLAENTCASAAYYIASATDYIIAQPASVIGSIGVVISFPIVKDLLEQYHVQMPLITAGDYKTTGSPFAPLTPEEQAMLKGITQETYHQFVRYVAERRPKLSPTATEVWANGKLFTGEKALELGLIDELGYMSALERVLRAKAPIEGDIVWVYPPRPSLASLIFGPDEPGDDDDTSITLSSWIRTALGAVINTLGTPQVR